MGRTGFGWLRIGSGGGFHKEARLFYDKLNDYHLFKEYSAPWSTTVYPKVSGLSHNGINDDNNNKHSLSQYNDGVNL
jgi:hypothetical protein